jgi:glycosyltransferase involved in cell wall biosynthesis
MPQNLRIAWLKSGPLHPLDTGGKLRTYNMLRELKRKHTITYVALCTAKETPEVRQAAAEYSHAQRWLPWLVPSKSSPGFYLSVLRNQLLDENPFIIERYRSKAMSEAIAELDRSGQFDLIICDFLFPAINVMTAAPRLATPTMLFQHNVESLILQRLYEQASNWPKRIYFKQQWRRMRAFEKRACEQFGSVVAVSEDECRRFASEFGLTNVMGAVPTGVDTEYFQPPPGPRQPNSLVFLGSMDWMPNIDAAVFFMEEVMPRLRQRFPDSTLTIVGRNPAARLSELAARTPGVRVTGTVDDVRPYLAQAQAMVVPLRIGGGTRIKIYEGMATGIPVVSTGIGAEGLPVKHGENILLADSPEQITEELGRLFQSPELCRHIGNNGLDFVRTNYGWAMVNRVFEAYCLRTAAQKTG